MNRIFNRTATKALGLLALSAAGYLRAETMIEHSAEVRFQLDLKVPEAALAALLPQGWTSNVSAQGAAKDCNVRAIFVDRVSINDAKGASIGKGSNRFAYLVAPVKSPTGENAQMVVAGLTEDPGEAPGPFGNYLLATTHATSRSSVAANSGAILDSQDWTFTAATGEHLELHIKFERGNAAMRNAADTKYYSAKNPSFYHISRQEQVLDILRNTTTNPPDRVKEFSFKCGGGSYAKLCDGSEKVLSWDNVLWLNRSVLLP